MYEPAISPELRAQIASLLAKWADVLEFVAIFNAVFGPLAETGSCSPDDTSLAAKPPSPGAPVESISEQDCVNLSAAHVLERFERCSHLLTEPQREVVRLLYGAGLEQKEIAKRLGKSESTVSGRLKRARETCKAYFRET